jgi:hypothetical protein
MRWGSATGNAEDEAVNSIRLPTAQESDSLRQRTATLAGLGRRLRFSKEDNDQCNGPGRPRGMLC